jgi:site-specific DNA-methyltransferase (adenine-specific)
MWSCSFPEVQLGYHHADGGAMSNTLYYGDNLDILRRYIPDESVDLVYLDPPLNSNATYNVLFGEHSGTQAADAGFYRSPGWNQDYPRLQILTLADLLAGKGISMPPPSQTNITHRRGRRQRSGGGRQGQSV